MKKQATCIQYTIRGVPPELDRALRRKAVQRKQSLNQVVLDELSVAAVGRKKRAEFCDLEHNLPLVTRDQHFENIPQLVCV